MVRIGELRHKGHVYFVGANVIYFKDSMLYRFQWTTLRGLNRSHLQYLNSVCWASGVSRCMEGFHKFLILRVRRYNTVGGVFAAEIEPPHPSSLMVSWGICSLYSRSPWANIDLHVCLGNQAHTMLFCFEWLRVLVSIWWLMFRRGMINSNGGGYVDTT